MEIKKNLELIKEKINVACKKSGRSMDEVCIIGVTKAHGYEAVIGSIKCGLFNIGESYVQEAVKKIEEVKTGLSDSDYKKITWHFLGGLQTNKIKYLKDNFAYIHSIDNERQLEELNKRITSPLRLFFEINTGNEKSKSGGTYESTVLLLEKLLLMNEKIGSKAKPVLEPYGLMCIPPVSNEPERSRKHFDFLRACLERLNENLGMKMKGLSMGMSDDFDIAVEEGSTHVRIGTMLYGERGYF